MFEPYKKLLTIGIPVYNEEKYIQYTIESCIEQAGTVIVSDNFSTDNTQKICEELAKKYSNLVYIRQEKNIGGSANFKFCVDYTKTKYFMWMGAHDYLDEGYSNNMLHMLENSDAAACWPASRSVDIDGNEIGIYDCWFAERLVGDASAQRVYALIAHLHDCVGLFGIHKTEIVHAASKNSHYIIGGDHVFMCEVARLGRIIYCPRSVYNWRQTKFNISDEQAMEIWSKSLGNEGNKTKKSRKEMILLQLQSLKLSSNKGGVVGFFKKQRLISKAKKKLALRFGK